MPWLTAAVNLPLWPIIDYKSPMYMVTPYRQFCALCAEFNYKAHAECAKDAERPYSDGSDRLAILFKITSLLLQQRFYESIGQIAFHETMRIQWAKLSPVVADTAIAYFLYDRHPMRIQDMMPRDLLTDEFAAMARKRGLPHLADMIEGGVTAKARKPIFV